jgi:hypothetical protein
MLRGAHSVTKGTWMGPIECLGDCLAKRRTLRVLNEHCCPRHRLKSNPMQTDCAAKRENGYDPAGIAKHEEQGNLRGVNVNVRCTRPRTMVQKKLHLARQSRLDYAIKPALCCETTAYKIDPIGGDSLGLNSHRLRRGADRISEFQRSVGVSLSSCHWNFQAFAAPNAGRGGCGKSNSALE